MLIHGKNYTEVKDRIPELLTKYPNGSIITSVFWHSEDFNRVCVRATIEIPTEGSNNIVFTGLAYEERVGGDREVNATSWVENAETSAIGRALANMNIGVNGVRPSAEEMQKVERMGKAEKLPWDDIEPPVPTPAPITSTKPSMEFVLMESRVRKAEDLPDLKRIWGEIQPGLKDITPAEKKKITQIKDERKDQLKGEEE
jgi:hypothetical protein